MNRPSYISFKDWDILNSKYSSTELEEYFNKNYPYQYLKLIYPHLLRFLCLPYKSPFFNIFYII